MSEQDQLSWHETWMQIAMIMSQRSRCTRAQVGAVIVNSSQRIVSSAYNGPAAKFTPTQFGPCTSWCARAQGTDFSGNYDSCPSIHAEANAIAFVDRSAVESGTIYVTRSCCMNCAKLISNSGIDRVVMRITKDDEHRDPDTVIKYLKQCGISVKEIREAA